MSLTLTLHSISGLKGHGDRVAKITFRELSHSTRLLQNCSADALFGEKFEWPVASDVQDGDVIEVCLYNSLVFGRNKVVGRFVMVLQEVVKVGFLEVSETLLDDNNCALQATIRLTLTYSAPDGTVGSWQTEEFRPSGRPNSAFELDEESDARSLRSSKNSKSGRRASAPRSKGLMKAIGLQKKQRPVDSRESSNRASMHVLPNATQPITAIPAHLQQQRQFNFDPLSDGQSIVSNNVITEPCTNKRSKPEMASESQIGLRNNQFQVTITVIEARQLMGTNMDPVVEVKVGDECRFTSQKSSTNCPYYNEVFVFDFNIPRGVFLDKMVTLTVLHSKNMLRSGTLVGRFKMDVRTVYEAPDHQFFHRWAILTDGKNAACKGYLKMDISVLAKGDMLRSIKPTDNDKEDDIENNLLLPHGITERVMARYYFRVFYAEGLPKMSSDTVGKIKSVIKGENRDLIDPYVEISFAGQKRRTSTEHTYEAQWNEMLQFTELFPALCQRVQIQVRNDGMQDSVIATHFLDMSKISNQGDKGYLPTFGPTYINLYGSPRGYSVTGEHGELNDGIGEGVAFRGRLVVACHIELIDEAADDNAMEDSDDEAEPRPIQSLSENSLGRVEEFFLFTTFLEASMIDKKATDKPISFEVSIGNYGNVVDGKNIPSKSDRQKDADDDHDDADTKSLISQSNMSVHSFSAEAAADCRSTTPSMRPLTNDKQYYHMPFNERKPCCYVTSYWHDHKRRLYNTNLLERVCDKLREGIDDVEEMTRTEQEHPERRLRAVMDDLANGTATYLRLVKSAGNQTGASAVGRTRLDRERQRLCLREIERVSNEAAAVRKVRKSNLDEKLAQANDLLGTLNKLMAEPQDSVPDIIIWMLRGGKRHAFTKISARQVFHSIVEEESGKHCGKIQTRFLTLPGRKGLGSSGWTIQAKLEIYMWFGLAKNKKDYLRGLPNGYDLPPGLPVGVPPPFIIYKDRQQFVLRSHLFQGRGLIAADSSGLSDPFAKVIFSTCVGRTQVIDKTLSPTWDEMIEMTDITMYGKAEDFQNDPPMVIVEIFDQDEEMSFLGQGGKEKAEYIGRLIAKPVVKMAGDPYDKPNFPPTLDWYQVYRGTVRAGEVLACFELLQQPVDSRTLEKKLWRIWCESKGLPMKENDIKVVDKRITEQGVCVSVPRGIRPILAPHRVEVLFWGLRDLKRVNLMAVNHPRVEVEIAGKSIESEIIENYKKNPNFSIPIKFIEDVELPDNQYLCPPITIKAKDTRTFGQDILLGTHIIRNVSKFFYTCPPKHSLAADEASLVIQGSIHESQNVAAKETKSAVLVPIDEDSKKDDEEEATDEVALDWWSKYFASKETNKADKAEAEQNAEPASDDENGNNAAENSKDPPVDSETQSSVPNHTSGDNSTKPGAKKLIAGNIMSAVQKAQRLTPSHRRKKKSKIIEELKIFDAELEAQPEFNGFTDLFHSFELYRGKMSDDGSDENRVVGGFKGGFKIYRMPVPKDSEQPCPVNGMFKGLPSNEPIHVLCRVYIVQCNDLHPMDPNGKADPYLKITLGGTTINDKDNYVSKQLNPVFGKCFDIEATFPMDSQLSVQVFDWDLLSGDDLIGETKIDLENRFYSKHRATCGYSQRYAIFGYNQWRDPQKPTQILTKLCKEAKLDGPYFENGKVRIGKRTFTGQQEIEDENGLRKATSEHAALIALKNWHDMPKAGVSLVPEHVECRGLYNPENPGIEQGKVEMWVDMFPMDMPAPGPPVDISPRKPKKYELRVIIWNTDEVICEDDDVFTGEKMSDIYVKGWINGLDEDKQETDIHYRSLTGEGNFNWRFMFPFDYLVAEQKIVVSKKESVLSWDETEFRLPARLTLQVWDADHFSADDFLGEMVLDLNAMPRGAKTAKSCTVETCTLENGNIPTVSLFQLRRIKGWWPFLRTDEANPTGEKEVTGKVEAEIHLMTFEEAEKAPAGRGREEPDPLEKPNRPDTSFVWFMTPLKSIQYLICVRFKWWLIKGLCFFLVLLLFGLFLYSAPGLIMQKLLGV